MSCIKPITITNTAIKTLFKKGLLKTSSIEVSCGRCINCRITKQAQLSYLCSREMLEQYKKGHGNSFVTLTYDDNHIPTNDKGFVTLRKTDLQKFMKRIRRNLDYHYGLKSNAFKYLACGELGDANGRPHYHICFFGLSTEILHKISRKVWKFGLCDIGVLTSGGVRYVCKYMTKQNPTKEVKELRLECGVENPFINHSFGLGKDWINSHLQEIADNNFQFNVNGKIEFYPKYILRYVSLKTGKDYRPIVEQYSNRKDYIEWKRENPDIYTLDSYRRLKAQNTYRTNVEILRSKGITVDPKDVSLTRAYKPFHKVDRVYIKELASQALLVDVPF